MDASSEKAALRKTLLAERSRQRASDLAEKFCANAKALLDEVSANLVASYHPLSGEPNLTRLNEQLMREGRLVLPAIMGETLVWRFPERLEPGPFGTTVPIGEELELGAIDLMLVPAVAIDHAGYRLGRGGGFYDRTLAARAGLTPSKEVTPILFGVVYHDEFLSELPHLPHDVRMHGVVTEVEYGWFV